ncbi:MAG: FkbM family methyltransferase [Flavobacteriales bacterium]|nr:FkbM family methyltransferase [Flavobacteriales bacterium]
MGLKQRLVDLMRTRALQPLWVRLHRTALVGMNHYGGADLRHSGEAYVLGHVARLAGPGPHGVVDAGGHFGYYTELALRAIGGNLRVELFEPSPIALEVLQKTLAGPLKEGVVRCHKQALGDAPGQLTLHLPAQGSSYASLHPFDPLTRDHVRAAQQIDVEVTTLDAHCAAYGIERILLLKIDVEGHELHVLRGARGLLQRGAIRFIQFEFGEADIDSRTFFLDIFRELGPRYTIHRVLPNGLWSIARYSPDLEVFHVTNYLAVLKVEEPQLATQP